MSCRALSRERATRGNAQIRYQGRSQAVARSSPRQAQAAERSQSPPRRRAARLRRPARLPVGRRRAHRAGRPPRRRRAADVQDRRHLRAPSSRPRRRTTTRPTRTRTRSGRRAPQGDHPRLGAQPHRPGHRVRLLLRPRQLRPARRRLRDGDGQLQPRDGVDRLRHLRPPLLRAAHARGRAQRHRGRAALGHRCRGDRRRSAARRRSSWPACCPPSWSWARSPTSIDLAEDRERWNALCARLEIPQPAGGTATTVEEALAIVERHRLPGAAAAVLRARRAGHGDRLRRRRPAPAMAELARLRHPRAGGRAVGRAPGAHRPLPRGRHRGRRRRHPRPHRRGRRSAGSWSTSRRPACTPATAPAPSRRHARRRDASRSSRTTPARIADALDVAGLHQRPVRGEGRARCS